MFFFSFFFILEIFFNWNNASEYACQSPTLSPSKFKFERHPAVGAQTNSSTVPQQPKNITWHMDVILTVSSKADSVRAVCRQSVSADFNENILSSDRCWWQESTNLASRWHVLLHVLWQAVMCLHRIMHWARRIEQEIDRVFQHITGAQQLKGVSTSLCSTEISLMSSAGSAH